MEGWKGNGQQKNDTIDAGLAILASMAHRDQRLSCQEIAEVCDCSRSLIWQIERQAMKKLRARLIAAGLSDAL